jgi:hypothetical protein
MKEIRDAIDREMQIARVIFGTPVDERFSARKKWRSSAR